MFGAKVPVYCSTFSPSLGFKLTPLRFELANNPDGSYTWIYSRWTNVNDVVGVFGWRPVAYAIRESVTLVIDNVIPTFEPCRLVELANKAGSTTCANATRPHPAATLRARPHYAIAPCLHAVKTVQQHPNHLINCLDKRKNREANCSITLVTTRNSIPLPKLNGELTGWFFTN